MPSSKIDKDAVLGAIAAFIAEESGQAVQTYLRNLKQLDRAVVDHPRFPWEQISHHFGLTRQQLYRWYFDTHQRNLYGPVSADDIKIIKRYLQRAIKEGQPLDGEFQRSIKEKLSQQYQRNSFTVAFNNTKRLLQQTRSTSFSETSSSGSSEFKDSIDSAASKDSFSTKLPSSSQPPVSLTTNYVQAMLETDLYTNFEDLFC